MNHDARLRERKRRAGKVLTLSDDVCRGADDAISLYVPNQ